MTASTDNESPLRVLSTHHRSVHRHGRAEEDVMVMNTPTPTEEEDILDINYSSLYHC
jgi:hypothetical protein